MDSIDWQDRKPYLSPTTNYTPSSYLIAKRVLQSSSKSSCFVKNHVA